MRRALAIALLTIVAFTAIASLPLHSWGEINGISYDIFYDPLEGSGTMKLRMSLENPGESLLEYTLPTNIFLDGVVKYIYYTHEPSNAVTLVSCNDLSCTIQTNATSLTLYFEVMNIMEEGGIGIYYLYINTTFPIPAKTIDVDITIPGSYSVYPKDIGGLSVTVIGNYTNIKLLNPARGLISLILQLGIETETRPQTTQPAPLIGFQSFYVFLIVAALAAIIAVVIYLHRKKSVEELVASTDILTDELVRRIIKELGEAGDAGLSQAQLTAKIGAPKASISRRIRRLEEDGYVVVKRGGKQNIVTLTNKGLDAYKRIAKK